MFTAKSPSPGNNTSTYKQKSKDPSKSYESDAALQAWKTNQAIEKTSYENDQPKSKEEVYKEILTELKKLLLRDTQAYSAIQAYEIIDNLQYEDHRQRIQDEHPYLMELMFDNLPASYLAQPDIGFFEGISKASESGDGKSGVDRMFELLSKPSTWNDLELLELVISILGQPDRRDEIIKDDQKNSDSKEPLIGELAAKYISELPETTKNLNKQKLEILARCGFVPQNGDKQNVIQAIESDEEYDIGKLVSHFIFGRKVADDDFRSKLRFGAQALGLSKKAASIEEINLAELQNDLGGHLGGMKISSNDKGKGSLDESTQQWLQEKGGEEFEQIKELSVGAIAYFADLKNGKAKLLAGGLPFEKLDYIDNDLSVRGMDGAFRKLFLNAEWIYPQFKDRKGLTQVNIKVQLDEVEMNQLRVIDAIETYGIGKLLIKGSTLDITTTLTSMQVRNGGDFMFALLDIVSNLGTIISDMSNILICRIQKKGFKNAGESLARTLAGGIFNNFDVSFKFKNALISNFVGTELGHIGEIQLSETKIFIKPGFKNKIDKTEEKLINEQTSALLPSSENDWLTDHDPLEVIRLETELEELKKSAADAELVDNEFQLQKEIEKKQNKLDNIKERRSKSFKKNHKKRDAKIEDKTDEVNALRKELDEKKEDDLFELNVTSESLSIKNAQLVEEITRDLITDLVNGIHALEMSPIENLSELSLTDLSISSFISPKETSDTKINVGKVNIPEISAYNFAYTILMKQEPKTEEEITCLTKELYKITGFSPRFQETEITNLSFEMGAYTQNKHLTGTPIDKPQDVKNVKLDKIKCPQVSLDFLHVYDLKNYTKLTEINDSILGQLIIEGLSVGDTTDFNSIAFNLSDIPVKGNASYGGLKGDFGISDLNFHYAKNQNSEENVSNDKITLGSKLDFLKIPNFRYGSKSDDFYLRNLKGNEEAGSGANLKEIDVSIDYWVNNNEIQLNHFNIDEILVSNILGYYKGNIFALDGESKISKFYLKNLGLNLKKEETENLISPSGKAGLDLNSHKEKPMIDIDNLSAGFDALNISKIWHGMSNAQGISTGALSINRIEDGKGTIIKLDDLDYDKALYQEHKGKEGSDANTLKTLGQSTMEGKADIEVRFMDDGKKNLKFKLPNGNLELSKAYFNDGEGNYFTHNPEKTPLKLISPVFDVTIDTAKNIVINNLSISGIEAAGLKGEFNTVKFEMPDNSINTINNIHATRLQLTGGPIKGSFSIGETDIQKIHIDISNLIGNRFITAPFLKWDKLTFDGNLGGNFEAEVSNLEIGTGKASGENDKYSMLFNDYPNFRMKFQDLLEDTNLFEAPSIKIKQEIDDNKDKKQIITLKEPVLKTIEINGDFFIGESEFDFKKVILSGKVNGDLEIENNPYCLMINSVTEGGGNSITLEEGTIILHDNELQKLKSGNKKDKEESDKPLDEMYSSDSGMFDFLDGANGVLKLQLNDDGFFNLPIIQGAIHIDPFLDEVEDYILIKTDEIRTDVAKTKNKFTGKENNSYNLYFPGGSHTLINNADKNTARIGREKTKYQLNLNPLRQGPLIVPVPYFHQEYVARISAIIDSQLANFAIEEEYNRRNNINTEDSKVLEYLLDKFYEMNPKLNIELNDMDLTKLPDDLLGKDAMLNFFGKSSVQNISLSFDEINRTKQTRHGNINQQKQMPEIKIRELSLPEFMYVKNNFQFDAGGLDIESISFESKKNEPNSEVSLKNISVNNYNITIYKK